MEFPYKHFLADIFGVQLTLKWCNRLHFMTLTHQNLPGAVQITILVWPLKEQEDPQFTEISMKMTEYEFISGISQSFSVQISSFWSFVQFLIPTCDEGCPQSETEGRAPPDSEGRGGAESQTLMRLQNFRCTHPLRSCRSVLPKILFLIEHKKSNLGGTFVFVDTPSSWVRI
jgi:hypothetical protein